MDIEDDYDVEDDKDGDGETDWEDEKDDDDEDDKDDDEETDREDEENDDDEDDKEEDDDDYERFRDYYDDRYFKIYGRPRVRRPRLSVPSTNSTCGVCWDRVAVNDLVQGKVMPGCQHETNVCRSCLAQSITAQLESKLWNQLTCPLCTVRIDGTVVEKFATSDTISR